MTPPKTPVYTLYMHRWIRKSRSPDLSSKLLSHDCSTTFLKITKTDSYWSKEGRRVLAEYEEEAPEVSRSDADEEETPKNEDVHSSPVRVLEALAENNDAEQSVVRAVQLD